MARSSGSDDPSVDRTRQKLGDKLWPPGNMTVEDFRRVPWAADR